jgi:hypothetical protein
MIFHPDRIIGRYRTLQPAAGYLLWKGLIGMRSPFITTGLIPSKFSPIRLGLFPQKPTQDNSGDNEMKRLTWLLIGISIVIGLTGCSIISREISTAETLPEQSTFKQTYAIGSVVEAHTDLLLEGPRTVSGSEAGTRTPFVQSQEIMTLQIEQENVTALMRAIQSDVQDILSNSGATITGSSGFDGQADPIAYFSYNYREGPFYGVINVWGVRGIDTQLTLISEITESLVPEGN